MKKIILIVPLVLTLATNEAKSALSLDLTCPCDDGSIVNTGEYCPGATVACGDSEGDVDPQPVTSCPSSCPSETLWITNLSKNYRSICDKSGGIAVCEYECVQGYYGSNPIVGCTKCPDGGISDYGATKITDCYVNSGSDESGDYEYTASCYYTE